MSEHLGKIISSGPIDLNSQAVQEHSCQGRGITIAALLDLLLDPHSAGVDAAVGSQNFLGDWIRNNHIVQRVRPPRIEYHQVHALIAGRVDVVENSRDFDPDRLTTMTNHLRQTRHQVIVRGIGEVAIEPTFLVVEILRVNYFAAGSGRMMGDRGAEDGE